MFSVYDPTKVGLLFTPQLSAALAEGEANPSRTSGPRTILLLVDPQVDFIHLDGALSVPGAIDDTRRTIEWIYRNLGRVHKIAASLDTHYAFMIFHPSWWEDEKGNHPSPFTTITLDDYRQRKWRAVARLPFQDRPGHQIDWNEYYLTTLEQAAKKQLMIWPYHCLIGSAGHNIEPSLLEAIYYHAGAQSSQPRFLIKGDIAKTENYSILEPEVKVNDHPKGGLNTEFLQMLADYDLIYIAGQAKSHCVYETVRSILNYFQAQAPDVIKRLRILEDCTSSVATFETFADQAFADFQVKYDLKLVRSTDPLG